MRNDVLDLIKVLNNSKCVAITAHERPDGDALGASLALRRILAECGIQAQVVFDLPLPQRYEWLVREGEVIPPDSDWMEGADFFVVLDCGMFSRIGAFADRAVGKLSIINIDHHDSNTIFGDFNWVDSSASSVGEMVFRLAKEAGWNITPEAATAVWTAIVTDTGGFSYENTSSGSLRIGAELIELGVRPSDIHQRVFQSLPLKEMRLTEHALSTLEVEMDGRVASVMLSREDFLQLDCTPENATDIVNIPRSIQGVEVAVFFYELFHDDATKVSVRTVSPRDAIDLCAAFGGGGHHRAAGCKIAGDADVAKHLVIDKIHELWYE